MNGILMKGKGFILWKIGACVLNKNKNEFLGTTFLQLFFMMVYY